jgi:hypothetical protein
LSELFNLAFNLRLHHNAPGCTGFDIAGVVRRFFTLKIFLTHLFYTNLFVVAPAGPVRILNQFDKICKQKRKKGLYAKPIP